jgi:multiple sugar transport system permease protein
VSGRLTEALGAARGRRFGQWLTWPAQAALVFIIAFPTVVTVYISLTWWTPLDGVNWLHAYKSWAWFDNYVQILHDRQLGAAVARTLLIVALAVSCELVLGFGLALLFLDRFALRPVYYTLCR